MKFSSYGIFCRDFSNRGMEYALQHSAELGFQSVEFLGMMPSEQPLHTRVDTGLCRELLTQHGLSASCLSICADLSRENWYAVEPDMLAAVDFAAEVGAPFFHHTLFPSYTRNASSAPYEEILQKVLPWALRIAERCAYHSITCLYEPQGAYFNDVEGLDILLNEVRRQGLPAGICGDVGNSLFVGVSPEDIFEHFAADIRHVHVKDYLLTQAPIVGKGCAGKCGETYLYDCNLGDGIVNIKKLFQCLQKAGYTGDISFETVGNDEPARQEIAWIRKLCQQTGLL